MKIFGSILSFFAVLIGGIFLQTPREEEVIIKPIVENPIVEIEIKKEPEIKIEESSLLLSEKAVPQGETLVVEAVGPISSLWLNDKEIPLAYINNRNVAVIGFDTREKVGPRTLSYETPKGKKTVQFQVVDKIYPVTKIIVPEKLAAKGVTSGELATSLAKKDNVSLLDIVSVETDEYHIDGKFVEPVDTWINVGVFGAVREDQYGSIRHLGIDLEGDISDPVYAINRGVVVYAGNLENYGNTIVIDHGVGIFSLYLHLSELETSINTLVVAGEKIGQVGNTGDYTLEPHLHFSMKVHGVSVDPRTFIDIFNQVLSTQE